MSTRITDLPQAEVLNGNLLQKRDSEREQVRFTQTGVGAVERLPDDAAE